eukprot:gene17544-17747_t
MLTSLARARHACFAHALRGGANGSRIAACGEHAGPWLLRDCDLAEADVSGLDLTGWRFERCDMRRIDLSGARLEATHWQGCRGGLARLVGADLTDAVVTSCDWNNAALRNARLAGAAFTGCKLTGADLAGATSIDTRFEECLLIAAKLPGHSFHRKVLRRVDLGQADLTKCDFRETVFEACSLRDAQVAGARFDKADLRGADLGGLQLVDARLFRGATISHEQASQLLGGDVWPGGGISPGGYAPVVVRGRDRLRRLVPRQWGVPPPPRGTHPVTHLRNVESPFWIGTLRHTEFRCLVPVTAFRSGARWFGVPSAPVFALAGVWRDSEVPSFAMLTVAGDGLYPLENATSIIRHG